MRELSLDDLYVELSLQSPFYIPDGAEIIVPTSRLAQWAERQMLRIGFYRKYSIRSGRKLLTAVEGDVRAKLCDEWGACEKLKLDEKYKDESQLIQVVAGVIETALAGLPVIVVSALIVKIGVRRFCNCADATA